MIAAFPLAEGVYGDMRNAIIAVTALTAGPIAAALCAVVAVAFRVALGGQVAGAVIGIALCTTLSLVFRALPIRKTPVTLTVFAILLARLIHTGPESGLADVA